ncbi:MAG: fimbrillin family protein [Bacteroidales bacterium]
MKKMLFFTSLLVLTASCMKNTDITEKAPLNVTPSISMTATKALVDDANIQDMQIGVHISNAAGNALYDAQAGYNNILLSNTAGSWGLSSTAYLSSSLAKIFAYYPHSSTAGDLTGIGATASRLLNIPATQVMANQVDYLWAAQDKTTPAGIININNENPSVNLKLNHSLAQIAFVVWKENFSGAGVISAIQIKDNTGAGSNLKINKTGTNDLKMKLADGTISGGEASSTLSLTGINSTIVLTADPGVDPTTLKNSVNAHLLLVPTSISDKTKIQLTFTIDSKNYLVSLSGATPVSFTPGNQYIYKVKLSGTALTITGVTVTEWTRNYGGSVDIK